MKHPFSIIKFLKTNGDYENKDGVIVDAIDDQSVFVSSLFPESMTSEVISVTIENELDEQIFTRLFQVKSKKGLDIIDHRQFIRLYQAGLMKVTCRIDEGISDDASILFLTGQFTFQITAKGTVVRNDGMNEMYLIPNTLSSFEDFVSYTVRHLLVQQGHLANFFLEL